MNEKNEFSDTNEFIDELSSRLISAYHSDHPNQALKFATEIELLLEGPPANEYGRHIYTWILIYEAKGNLKEAIRLSNIVIAKTVSQIESGDYAEYPTLLTEELELLNDELFLQADR